MYTTFVEFLRCIIKNSLLYFCGIDARPCVYTAEIALREPKSISVFVAGFKSALTARINTLQQANGKQVWQVRFHDPVIRDYEEYRRIGTCIDMKIANWNEGRYCNY